MKKSILILLAMILNNSVIFCQTENPILKSIDWVVGIIIVLIILIRVVYIERTSLPYRSEWDPIYGIFKKL